MPKMCSESARRTLHGPTMGTRWSVTLDDERAADLAALERALAAAVQQVDRQMSPWQPDSALNRLNRAAVGTWVALPPEMLSVLARALEIARLSAGAFDPTVGAPVHAWGFGAARVRDLLRQGAIVRVCGSRPMAHGVAEALDAILGALRLSVQQLKAKGRYAEDLF